MTSPELRYRTQNDRPGECDDEASKHNPQGGQVVKLRAPEWLCDAHERAGDRKVETNEIRTLPPPPDGHNVRLDDDQSHGPDPPRCTMRSTPAHLQPPSDRQVLAASCIPRRLLCRSVSTCQWNPIYS
jgi:hypothetical protein